MKVDSFRVMCGKISDPFTQQPELEENGVAFEDDDDRGSGVVIDRKTVSTHAHCSSIA